MGNHFHLLLEVPRGNLSTAMRDLLGDFCSWLNFVHGWDGPVFKGRFQNRVVESDAYWTHLLAYVHCNPVRSGLVSDPADAQWTSCPAYRGLIETPAWLTTSELLEHHGGRQKLAAYAAEVALGRESGPSEFDSANFCAPGSSDVVGSAVIPCKSVEDAVDDIRAITGKGTVDLLQRGRRRGVPATAVLAWWLSRSVGVSYRDQAVLMGITPGAIGQRVRRVESLRLSAPDGLEAGWVRALLAAG